MTSLLSYLLDMRFIHKFQGNNYFFQGAGARASIPNSETG